jgi:nitrous-oxide reductase
MKLLLDFPTVGEPHYAQAVAASLRRDKSVTYFDINKNQNPYVTKGEAESKVVRISKRVDIYITQIRSHFSPDNIEGIKAGYEVYWHVTNLEQDWDILHGFAIKSVPEIAELFVMPGETQTYKWMPKKAGIYPFYCTDFCSALHQEMQGYVRVSSAESNVPLTFSTGKNLPDSATAPPLLDK